MEGDLTPGCGVTYEDFLSRGYLVPPNKPLGARELLPADRNAELFTNCGLEVDRYDHMVTEGEFTRRWATPEQGALAIQDNPGCSRLKYLPLLQWFNVYRPGSGWAYTINVVELRRRCSHCDRLELLFDEPNCVLFDDLFQEKRDLGVHCRLRACAGCKEAWYCSRECQLADWKDHKKDCTGGKHPGVAKKEPQPEPIRRPQPEPQPEASTSYNPRRRSKGPPRPRTRKRSV
jgi:hypothetical protein